MVKAGPSTTSEDEAEASGSSASEQVKADQTKSFCCSF